MEKIKSFFNIFYWIIAIFLIMVASLVSLSALSIPGGRKLFVVQSGSMEPTLEIGSMVLVEKKDTYGVGEIVTFWTNGAKKETTTHRVIKEEVLLAGKELFTTKGDANQGEDRQRIGVEEILGKTILVIPYLGYLISFSRTQMGFIFLIVVPSVIIVYSELLNLKKYLLELLANKKKSNTEIFLRDTWSNSVIS